MSWLKKLNKNLVYLVLITLIFNCFCFESHNTKAFSYDKLVDFRDNKDDYIDYSFTSQEINLSKITDSSITIYSENIDHEFLKNAEKITVSNEDYDVKYDGGHITIEGLIPDFLYNTLYLKAESGDEDYVIEVKNFKTLKSKDTLRQFITKTLQYTLRSSVRAIDFYMWEDKLLKREVTPEQFILNILEDPQVLYNSNSCEDVIGKIYSSVFAQYINNQELEFWKGRFDYYKSTNYLNDQEVYSILARKMMSTDDFKNRVNELDIENREVPESTRYSEVFENSKKDYRYGKQKDGLYVMDYYELNRSKGYDSYIELCLSDEFSDTLYPGYKFSVSIDGANAFYRDGKIVIDNLEPNTVYRNFIISYWMNGKEKIIFVNRVSTLRDPNSEFFNQIDLDFNVLNEFNCSIEDFIIEFYCDKYKIDVDYDEIDDLKILFVSNKDKISDLKEYFIQNINVNFFGDEILINKLYDVIFDRFSDREGLKYWVSKFRSYKITKGSVMALSDIATEICMSDEFKERFNDAILIYLLKENNYNKKLLFL